MGEIIIVLDSNEGHIKDTSPYDALRIWVAALTEKQGHMVSSTRLRRSLPVAFFRHAECPSA